MAASKTLTIGSTANQRPYGVLTVKETSTSATANTSTLSITLVLKRPSAISSSATKSASCTINGTKYTWSGTIGGSGDKTLISKTQTVAHNSDGSKTINIAASIALDITWGGVSLGTISGSSTLALTNLPQYATVTQTLSSKTETTAVMKYTCDSTIDYIWYSTNGGSSWTGVNVADGSSGTYTISGLSANTTYSIKTRVRRKDSQRTTDSSALSVTTYAFPYANSMPSFTIGSKLTIGLYNPLGRSVQVNILGADNSQISDDTTSGTSISGYNGAGVVNRLYASIPNAKSGTYKVKVTYGQQVTTKTGGTYTVNQNVCKPSVTSVSYQDTNATTTALTGNNQLIIQNQSKVQISAVLAPNNSATIRSCQVAINGVTSYMTVSGTTATVNNLTINSASDLQATVTMTDSRGLTATKSVNVDMLAWELPTAEITLQRQDNYYSNTNITVDTTYSSLNGKNTISIVARYKKTTDAEYGDDVTLQDNVTSVLPLDNRYEWNVQIELKDKFGTTTYNASVSIGMPIIYHDIIKSSTGFNCFPQDEKSVEVNGFNIARSIVSLSLGQSTTPSAVNSYVKIALDLDNTTGTRLTATNDGGVKIGSGVTKILVSGRISVKTGSTAGSRHIRIVRNTYSAANTLGWCDNQMAASNQNNVMVTPILADVQEGDIIYLYGYFLDSSDQIGGGSANLYGGRTSLTVEAVG